MKTIYKGMILAKGSKALELYQEWQKSRHKDDEKKFKDHMKDVEKRYQELVK